MQSEHDFTTKDASFSGWIGVSQEDITPPAGIYSRNWGAASHETAEGIHRPLKLTCFTFQAAEDGLPLILISADLGWWKSAGDERRLREGILRELGLQAHQLMFCLTHTHAGPSLFSEDAAKPGGELIAPYLRTIREKAVDAIRRALRAAALSTLTWRYGKCDLAVNRDLREPGAARFLAGMNPHGKADDTLLAGRITDMTGKIRGTIVNYACHPTTLGWANRLISPDYIGSMRELVEESTLAPCLFLQGASGELAPREQYTGDAGLADAYGRELGYAALSVLAAMLPAGTQLTFEKVVESGAPLAIWERKPRQSPGRLEAEMVEVEMTLKDLPSLDEIEAQWLSCTDRVLKERLWRKRGIRKSVGEGASSAMPLWIWRLGEAFLVGQPNEAYSDYQQSLRQSLAPYPVAVMNIVNGYAGYLPPAGLYDEDMYSVWQTPFAAGSLELLLEKTIETARKLI